jgi:hypothetical protein
MVEHIAMVLYGKELTVGPTGKRWVHARWVRDAWVKKNITILAEALPKLQFLLLLYLFGHHTT